MTDTEIAAMEKENARLKDELLRLRTSEQRYIEKIVYLEDHVRTYKEIAVNLSIGIRKEG